jgi:hypothetical protein
MNRKMDLGERMVSKETILFFVCPEACKEAGSTILD